MLLEATFLGQNEHRASILVPKQVKKQGERTAAHDQLLGPLV